LPSPRWRGFCVQSDRAGASFVALCIRSLCMANARRSAKLSGNQAIQPKLAACWERRQRGLACPWEWRRSIASSSRVLGAEHHQLSSGCGDPANLMPACGEIHPRRCSAGFKWSANLDSYEWVDGPNRGTAWAKDERMAASLPPSPVQFVRLNFIFKNGDFKTARPWWRDSGMACTGASLTTLTCHLLSVPNPASR